MNKIMSKQIFFSMAAATALFSVVMFLFPELDLAISHFFYNPQRGFLLKNFYNQWHLGVFRDSLVYITYGLITIITLTMIGGIFFKNLKMPLSPKIGLFLLICFAIAPTLVVNGILKNHWGRARPYQVQQFGGHKIFTPAWVMSHQCEKNCSFTSGETANVFCYLALLFVVRRKKLIASIILTVGALSTFERVAQGDHFFSDAILSGLLDYLLIWLIYHVMEKNYYFSPQRASAAETLIQH